MTINQFDRLDDPHAISKMYAEHRLSARLQTFNWLLAFGLGINGLSATLVMNSGNALPGHAKFVGACLFSISALCRLCFAIAFQFMFNADFDHAVCAAMSKPEPFLIGWKRRMMGGFAGLFGLSSFVVHVADLWFLGAHLNS